LPDANSNGLAAMQTDDYASKSASQAEAEPTEERARDEIFARADHWLQSDLDDLLDRLTSDGSEEADEDSELWWALDG
jgi:hypothetical protein